MLIQNVLNRAASLLNVEVTARTSSGGTELTHEGRMLAECAKNVYEELISDYFPLITEENIRFDSQSKISVAALSKKLLRVISIKRYAANFRYTVYTDSIEATGGANLVLTVRYAYCPDISRTIETFVDTAMEAELPADVTERIFALGTVTEYCLVNGMYNECVMYDKRYKDALQVATRKSGEKKLKARTWMQ
jgi:hypothetical protein